MSLVPHTPAVEAQEHAALVVAFDAGDLDHTGTRRAEALAASCAGCAALVDDLALIRAAMTTLPVPPRRRDYRLSAEDVARLRPSAWRRVLGWLAAPGSTVRPLATGLATLGVVGLLLTAGLPGFGAGGAAVLSTVGSEAGQPEQDSGTRTGNEAYGPAEDPGTAAQRSAAPSAAPAPSEAPVAGIAGEASPAPSDALLGAPGAPDGVGDATKVAPASPAGEDGPPISLVASIGLLAAGLGLLGARALALRRAR
jgi:hypothetical protein